VLSVNPANVVNGQPVPNLASGRFIFGNSGYRSAESPFGQYVILFSPDFDLSGRTNVHLSFHSLWEQNQDSIAAVEYSLNQGQSWLPVVYLLDRNDFITNSTGGTDALATFNEPHGDLPLYSDPVTGEQKGGTYGAFIAAPLAEGLAPFLSPRIDDDPVESKRVELFRLPQADNQSKVRFRFAHAGLDSWYFGLDNIGLYSIGSAPEAPVELTAVRQGNQLIISWPASATGYALETSSALPGGPWTAVPGVSGNSATVTIGAEPAFFRLKK
jgi:hypothetical protein